MRSSLKALVFLLLLANLAYFAWARGWLAGVGFAPEQQREPQRVEQQLRPDALKVLRAGSANAENGNR